MRRCIQLASVKPEVGKPPDKDWCNGNRLLHALFVVVVIVIATEAASTKHECIGHLLSCLCTLFPPKRHARLCEYTLPFQTTIYCPTRRVHIEQQAREPYFWPGVRQAWTGAENVRSLHDLAEAELGDKNALLWSLPLVLPAGVPLPVRSFFF